MSTNLPFEYGRDNDQFSDERDDAPRRSSGDNSRKRRDPPRRARQAAPAVHNGIHRRRNKRQG